MSSTIYVDSNTLVQIYNELDRSVRDMPFETAASLGGCFLGGFDHAEVKQNGWTLKLHDRGMNNKHNDFTFTVLKPERTNGTGPLA